MTNCTKCGAHIKNIIIIDNKPYGTECATTVLGIRKLPHWFKGGNWNKAKESYDTLVVDQKLALKRQMVMMDEYWGEWVLISRIYQRAHSCGNDWLVNFSKSILDQLGYGNSLNEFHYNSATEAYNNWKPYNGSFPFLYHRPKHIDELSPKQQELIRRNS